MFLLTLYSKYVMIGVLRIALLDLTASTQNIVKDNILFAQILKLQGHKNTLSYRKHQKISNDQQYKLVKLCCLIYFYK